MQMNANPHSPRFSSPGVPRAVSRLRPSAGEGQSFLFALLTVKRLPRARQGPATVAGHRAPLGTVGPPGPADPGRPRHCGARARSAAAWGPARRRPPQRRLTCSCGRGGLRACPPRTARACNLREDARRAQAPSARASGAAAGVWKRAAWEPPQSRPLTQIEDRQLREPLHGGRQQAARTEARRALFSRRLRKQLRLPYRNRNYSVAAPGRAVGWRLRKSAF